METENTENATKMADKMADNTKEQGDKKPIIMFKFGSVAKPFRCQVCNFCVDDADSLRTHISKHESKPDPNKPHRCTICTKSFQMLKSLERHTLTHYGHLSFKRCKFCYKTFNNKENLQRHIETHEGRKSFTCPICKQDFVFKHGLETHMVIHTGVRPFKCTQCEKSFNRIDILNRHLKTHENKEKMHKCVECGKCFSHVHVLKRHMRAVHSGEDLGETCPVCNKHIRAKENLARHMLIHTGERPFVCKVCNKSFSQKGHLQEHERGHSNDFPEKCNYCDESFKYRRALNRHYSYKHSDHRPYTCEICKAAFVEKITLTRHVQMHESRQHQCKICCQLFKKQSYLHKHLEARHSAADWAVTVDKGIGTSDSNTEEVTEMKNEDDIILIVLESDIDNENSEFLQDSTHIKQIRNVSEADISKAVDEAMSMDKEIEEGDGKRIVEVGEEIEEGDGERMVEAEEEMEIEDDSNEVVDEDNIEKDDGIIADEIYYRGLKVVKVGGKSGQEAVSLCKDVVHVNVGSGYRQGKLNVNTMADFQSVLHGQIPSDVGEKANPLQVDLSNGNENKELRKEVNHGNAIKGMNTGAGFKSVLHGQVPSKIGKETKLVQLKRSSENEKKVFGKVVKQGNIIRVEIVGPKDEQNHVLGMEVKELTNEEVVEDKMEEVVKGFESAVSSGVLAQTLESVAVGNETSVHSERPQDVRVFTSGQTEHHENSSEYGDVTQILMQNETVPREHSQTIEIEIVNDGEQDNITYYDTGNMPEVVIEDGTVHSETSYNQEYTSTGNVPEIVIEDGTVDSRTCIEAGNMPEIVIEDGTVQSGPCIGPRTIDTGNVPEVVIEDGTIHSGPCIAPGNIDVGNMPEVVIQHDILSIAEHDHTRIIQTMIDYAEQQKQNENQIQK